MQILVADEKLIGFAADNKGKILLIDGERVIDTTSSTRRHGSGERWELLTDEEPALGQMIYFIIFSKKRRFTIDDFPEGLAASIEQTTEIEDYNGDFDDRTRIWLKLTDAAMADRENSIKKICASDDISRAFIVKRI